VRNRDTWILVFECSSRCVRLTANPRYSTKKTRY